MGGSLRIAVSKNPTRSWSPSDGDRHLDFDLHPAEWEKLFVDYFGVPEWEMHSDKEESSLYFARQKERIEKHIAERGYPLLGRLWHIYDDAGYEPNEIQSFHRECDDLRLKVDDPLARSMVDKLLAACYQAEQSSSGLWFLSD